MDEADIRRTDVIMEISGLPGKLPAVRKNFGPVYIAVERDY